MKALNTLKNKKFSKTYLAIGSVGACFVFFVVFNLGLESYKESRGLASNELTEPVNEGVNKAVISNLSSVLEKKKTQHSKSPSEQERFLFEDLEGNYKSFDVEGSLLSITLKDGQQGVAFSESAKKDLVQKIKSIYFVKSVSFADPVTDRFMASEQLSYSLIENGSVSGRVDFRFTKNDELIEVKINRL